MPQLDRLRRRAQPLHRRLPPLYTRSSQAFGDPGVFADPASHLERPGPVRHASGPNVDHVSGR